MKRAQRRAEANAGDLDDLAARVAQAVAEAEADGRSGVIVAAVAFRRGLTVGSGGGVAFVFGRPKLFVLSLAGGFTGKLSQLY